MNISYTAQKCTSCAATRLQYNKETKTWTCMYCGTVIERQEKMDTMFTIKNVVRQAILDVAYGRMNNAQNNIVECQKIDSRYAGTLTAQIAYEMNMIIRGGISKAEQQNYFSMLKKDYMALKALGDAPTEEELALYEFFDSSEVIGVLILVFDSLGAEARREALFPFFEASEVYSMELNRNLINYAVKNQKYDMLDAILHNVNNIDKKAVLNIVLGKYPDEPRKADNAVFLIQHETDFTDEDRKQYERYLSESEDSAATKFAVAQALCRTKARPSLECLMRNVVARLSDAQSVFDMMRQVINKDISDTDIETILSYSLNNCSDAICLQNLCMLHETGRYAEITGSHFKQVLDREDISAEGKQKILQQLLEFDVAEKVRERFIADYLCETYDTPENRSEMLAFLLPLVPTLSTNTIEKYLFKCTIDKDIKPSVVKQIFSADINRSFFRQTLSKYITDSADSFAVKKEVVYLLLEAGLTVNAAACLKLLLADTLAPQEKVELLRRAKAAGVSYDEVLDRYMECITPAHFNSELFTELIQSVKTVSVKTIVKYVLECGDLSAAKTGNIVRMLRISYSDASRISCTVMSGGDQVVCNLVQGYILTARETPENALAVLESLGGDKTAVNSEIEVSGVRYKFKKYVAARNKAGSLNETAKALCVQCRML